MNFSLAKRSAVETMFRLKDIGEWTANGMFTNEAVKKLLDDKSEKFDLVIIEHFMNDVLIGLVSKLNIFQYICLESDLWSFYVVIIRCGVQIQLLWYLVIPRLPVTGKPHP